MAVFLIEITEPMFNLVLESEPFLKTERPAVTLLRSERILLKTDDRKICDRSMARYMPLFFMALNSGYMPEDLEDHYLAYMEDDVGHVVRQGHLKPMLLWDDEDGHRVITNLRKQRRATMGSEMMNTPGLRAEDRERKQAKTAKESGLSFDEYQRQARGTAVYPNQGDVLGLMYTGLGLAGEAGETADQIKKVLRDDDGVITAVRFDKCRKELGDTLWYIANACEELNAMAEAAGLEQRISLSDVAQHNLDKLHDRQDRGVLKGDGGIR